MPTKPNDEFERKSHNICEAFNGDWADTEKLIAKALHDEYRRGQDDQLYAERQTAEGSPLRAEIIRQTRIEALKEVVKILNVHNRDCEGKIPCALPAQIAIQDLISQSEADGKGDMTKPKTAFTRDQMAQAAFDATNDQRRVMGLKSICGACWGKKRHSVMSGLHGGSDFGNEGFEELPSVHMVDCGRCRGTGFEPESAITEKREDFMDRLPDDLSKGLNCPCGRPANVSRTCACIGKCDCNRDWCKWCFKAYNEGMRDASGVDWKKLRDELSQSGKWQAVLPEWIDRHYPKGIKDGKRGEAIVAITMFCLEIIDGKKL